jgi:predicted metal-dependent phosphoesterase TrpH
MYKGIMHFHSKYSYDSILSIDEIVRFALKNELNFLILTDHNTLVGSLKLKESINNQNLNINVIIGAEYKTEYGDIIALNIKEEIHNMNYSAFIKEVRKQGGVLLFPHPYKGHKNIEIIAKDVDMIEVFNSRVDDKGNQQALLLATKFKKPIYYASDAHNYKSLDNIIIKIDSTNNSLLESLLHSELKVVTKEKSYQYELFYSQYIKALKRKDIKLLITLSIRTIKRIIDLSLFRKI